MCFCFAVCAEPSVVVSNKRIPGPNDPPDESDTYDVEDEDEEGEFGGKAAIPVTPPNTRNIFNNGDLFHKKRDKGEDNNGIPSHVFIITIVLCVFAVAVIIIIIVIYVRRAHQKKYLYASGRSVLTFSNPNYNASSSDVGPNASQADKKPFLWKRLKYDKSQVWKPKENQT